MGFVERAMEHFGRGDDHAGVEQLKAGMLHYGGKLLQIFRECETADAGLLAHMMRLQAESILRSVPGAEDVAGICETSFSTGMVIINVEKKDE